MHQSHYSISERDFTKQVIALAELYGWLVYHVPDSRRCTAAGWPDLVLFHPVKVRLLIRELKVGKGRVRPEQHIWLSGLKACGFDAGLWRDSDWDSIVETLRQT
jgi:hypothetical protein